MGISLPAPAVGSSLPAPNLGDQAIRSSSYKRARGGKGAAFLVGVEQSRDEDERELSQG